MNAQSITGASNMCSGPESYSFSGSWVSGYQWVASTNLSISGSSVNSSVTVTPNGTGEAWVQVINGVGAILVKKVIWIDAGTINVTSISGPTSTPNGQYASYFASVPSNTRPTSYQWILSPQLNNNLYGASTAYLDIAFYTAGYYQLVARAYNACGWGEYYVTNLYVY